MFISVTSSQGGQFHSRAFWDKNNNNKKPLMCKNTEVLKEHGMFEEQEEVHYGRDVQTVGNKAGDEVSWGPNHHGPHATH